MFGSYKLDDIYVAYITVPVHGNIGYIDTDLMIPALVPVIQKADALIYYDLMEKLFYLGYT